MEKEVKLRMRKKGSGSRPLQRLRGRMEGGTVRFSLVLGEERSESSSTRRGDCEAGRTAEKDPAANCSVAGQERGQQRFFSLHQLFLK